MPCAGSSKILSRYASQRRDVRQQLALAGYFLALVGIQRCGALFVAPLLQLLHLRGRVQDGITA